MTLFGSGSLHVMLMCRRCMQGPLLMLYKAEFMLIIPRLKLLAITEKQFTCFASCAIWLTRSSCYCMNILYQKNLNSLIEILILVTNPNNIITRVCYHDNPFESYNLILKD